jgi:undecaprenyl diphosphate synthase
VIGRRDRLPTLFLQEIERAEAATASGARMHVRIAVDYSSRDAIVGAARAFHVRHAIGERAEAEAGEGGNGSTGSHGARDGFGRLLSREDGTSAVDLLIRTGGERRRSDFLLWESAYAELVFSRRMWPAFDRPALRRAVESFRARERRFGDVARSDAG